MIFTHTFNICNFILNILTYFAIGILFKKKDTISMSSGILSFNSPIIGIIASLFSLNLGVTLLLMLNILLILFKL